MQNSTQLFTLEKVALGRIKRIYSDHLFTLENNAGDYATAYLNNNQVKIYAGEGAWAKVQTYASMLTLNKDME